MSIGRVLLKISNMLLLVILLSSIYSEHERYKEMFSIIELRKSEIWELIWELEDFSQESKKLIKGTVFLVKA
jgi:hypothetical protein